MAGRSMRVFAKGRPGAIKARKPGDVSAPVKPAAFDRWNAGIRAAAGDEASNVITMYDVIGEDYWSGGGVTAKRIGAALRSIGNRDVEVHLNSPGGDMFEGIAIYNMLREHPAKVTVKVLGLAASAASIIAMAGDDVQIGAASFLMIHNCWVVAIGNQRDMRDTADWLAPFDTAMADVYAARTGRDRAEVEAWMDANSGDGTYFAGSQAVELGFADSLLPADAAKEDQEATARAGTTNAVRMAEHGLVAAGQSRNEARALLNKIKGKPDAALEDATRDAGDLSWIGQAADLTNLFRS